MANLPKEDEKTYPCHICGRQFVQHSLEKHQHACRRLSQVKRKVFDSGKQRATGSDVNLNDVRKVEKEREKLGGTFPRPKTSWRERHETFVSTVSASKQVNYALRTGTPLPPPPVASIPKDYVHCDYCDRNFNATAAERHIPFCRSQHDQKGPAKVVSSVPKRLPYSQSASSTRKSAHQDTAVAARTAGSKSADVQRREAKSLTRRGTPSSMKNSTDRHNTPSRESSQSRRSLSASRSAKSYGQATASREQTTTPSLHGANAHDGTPVSTSRRKSGKSSTKRYS